MSVSTRTNLVTNPSSGAASTGYTAVAGTGGTAALSRVTTGGSLTPTFSRVTWSVATTAISGGVTYGSVTGLVAGTVYPMAACVRSSITQKVYLGMDWNTAGGGYISTTAGAAVSLVANAWTALPIMGVAPATATQGNLSVLATTGGANWSIGATLDVQGLLVEAPTILRTNYARNANFEVDTSFWTAESGATLTRDTSAPISGTASGKLNTGGDVYTTAVATSGQAWTLSVDYKTSGTVTGTPQLYLTDGVAASVYQALPLTQTTPGRFSTTLPATSGGTTQVIAAVFAPTTGGVVWFDNVLLEPVATAKPFFDGSTPAASNLNYGWTGLPNASSSVSWAGPTSFFDGSFVNANSVMYAWTSTANASTSTAKTYVPTIGLVAKTDAPCPRVEVTISDVTPTDNVVNVWRTADGKRQAVRGARKWTVNGSNFIVDYEAPLGRSVAYDVEVTSGLNNGAGVTQQTTTVTSSTWWIQDPLIPSSAIALNVSKQDSSKPYLTAAAVKGLEYAAGVNIIPILGSPEPVALMGQRSIAANVDFSMFTNTASVTTQLRNLLQQTPLLLVRSNGVRNDGVPGLAYYAAAKPVEHPVTVPFGGTLTHWQLTGDFVAAPTMNVLVPIWTYQAWDALWPTYQAMLTALSGKTYLDVLKSPSGV